MTDLLLVLAIVVPLVALTVALHPRARSLIGLGLPIIPVPAFLAAILVADSVEYSFGWLLFAGSWSLDPTRRLLLAAMAAMWCVGGCFAIVSRSTRAQLPRLVLPWLATLTGNLWLAIAQDIAGFYSGFALMSFGAYALVVADGTDASRRAGRVYLSFTVLGEMAILCGLLFAMNAGANNDMRAIPSVIAASPWSVMITTFLLFGFGVKCALPGVHMWLPTVYTAAPAPVRVVLGGAMINAGVLGWVSTLPLGTGAASALALPLVIAGLVAALGAAVIGCMQERAATVLGYSSISQMGMLTALLGVGLVAPDVTGRFVAVIAIFAAHHGITKGALFVSAELVTAGVRHARLLFVWPALVLSGVPLTTGAIAKLQMKGTLYDAGWSWVVPWLTAAAVGTTLLMARALWCATNERSARSASTAAGTLLTLLGSCAVVIVLLGPWWLPSAEPLFTALSLREAIDLVLPIAVGIGIAVACWRRRYDGWRVPAGDLLLPVVAITTAFVSSATLLTARGERAIATAPAPGGPSHMEENQSGSAAERSEAWLQRHASFLLTAVMLLVAAVLLFSSS